MSSSGRRRGEEERDRDRKREKDKHKDKARDRDRSRERGRHDKKSERSPSDRHADKQERHERDRKAGSSRRHRGPDEKDERERSKRRSRSHSRPRSRSRSQPAHDGDRSHKRRRRDEDGEPAATPPAPAPAAASPGAAAMDADAREKAAQQQKDAEQALLDEEMEARRRRVAKWQAERQQQKEAELVAQQAAAAGVEAAAVLAAAQEAAAQLRMAPGGQEAADADAGKGWSLEDDVSDDEGGQALANGADDEIDPLDAFMAGNDVAAAAALAPQQPQQPSLANGTPTPAAPSPMDADGPGAADAVEQQAAQDGDDDEVDPLDAFMAQEVMPEVAKEHKAAGSAAAAGAAASAEPAPAGMAEVAEAAEAGPGAAIESARVSSQGPSQPAKATPPGMIGAKRGFVLRPSMAIRPANAGRAVNGGRGPGAASSGRGGRAGGRGSRRYYDSDASTSSDEEASSASDDEEWARAVTAGKLSKSDKLTAVDHSTINYPPFRRNFYIEGPEASRMTEADVVALRKELDGIKVRGRDPPKPIRSWTQSGLPSKVLDMLKKEKFENALPIQAQALPTIMSGRDCIGIAKTGSGKTLAFVLPMLRHIKDQPPLAQGDGPIGLIMAPTRELVQQIHRETKKFAKVLGLTSVAVFGGSGVANQISELKRGTEVVACTPGRMIDLLVTGGGKITNMRRVTFLVLDEADRMFDMGFEPQIMRIVNNTRPDRQTVMFSATFPRSVENAARSILHDPVEIQVGGRSVVNPDITQLVEIRPDSDRFLRLLEILGEWYEMGKIIIFVHSQERCDNLFRDLLKSGYPCLSLHGGKDQSDRECTTADFKGAVCNILVATSVAARGLDVKDLVLVVNYDVPNHHEDYVHRVGRTGRAGNKGTAITFIGPEEERYAPDLVKALKESSAPIPDDLQDMANSFNEKRKAGLVQGHGSGFGGSGFKFDASEDDKLKKERKAQAKEYGGGAGSDADEGNDSDDDADIKPAGTYQAAQNAAALAATMAAGFAAAAGGSGVGAGAGPSNALALVPAAGAPSTSAAAAAAAAAAAGPLAPWIAAGAVPPAMSAPMAVAASMAASSVPAGQSAPAEPEELAAAAAAAAAAKVAAIAGAGAAVQVQAAATAAARRAAQMAAMFTQGAPPSAATAAAQAAAAAAGTGAGGAAGAAGAKRAGFEIELEINDFPQQARWKVTHKGFQQEINELTGAAVTTRGIYYPPGGKPPPGWEGERRLFLLIEGQTEQSVKQAKAEIKRILEEATDKAQRRDAPVAPGRYSVV